MNTIYIMKTNLESKISALPLESKKVLIERPPLLGLIIDRQHQEIAELQREVKRRREPLPSDSYKQKRKVEIARLFLS